MPRESATAKLIRLYRTGAEVSAIDTGTPVTHQPNGPYDPTPWVAESGQRYRSTDLTATPHKRLADAGRHGESDASVYHLLTVTLPRYLAEQERAVEQGATDALERTDLPELLRYHLFQTHHNADWYIDRLRAVCAEEAERFARDRPMPTYTPPAPARAHRTTASEDEYLAGTFEDYAPNVSHDEHPDV